MISLAAPEFDTLGGISVDSSIDNSISSLEKRFGRLLEKEVCAVSSGTAALHLALECAGISHGDLVICPSLGFVACASVIRMTGADPVFVDVSEDSWTLDLALFKAAVLELERKGTPAKAVIVVHVFGQILDVRRIRNLADQHGIKVIEDVANALGGEIDGRPVGTFGHYAAFSFNRNKVITGFGGGLLVSEEKESIEKAKYLASHARTIDRNGYLHERLGFNYRMCDLSASLILNQMEDINKKIAAKRRIFSSYCRGFNDIDGISPMPSTTSGEPTRWLSCFTVDATRFGMASTDLVYRLAANEIESRPVWRALHTQPVFANAQRFGGGVAERLNCEGIALPSSTAISSEEIAEVISCVRGAYGSDEKL